jgi:hypothetical protein
MDLQIWFDWIPSWLEDSLDSSKTIRYTSPYTDGPGQPGLVCWTSADGAFYDFHYPEGIHFIMSRDGNRLWIRSAATVSNRDVLSYLLGPIMGLVLRVRGVVCLHASAVAVKQCALVFVGGSRAGKSTTAMAMGRLGYPIMSDDIVPIYQNSRLIYAQPAYPRMRLRQSSLPALSNINPDLPALPQEAGNARLHLHLPSSGYSFQPDPLPIGAIYLLADRRDDSSPTCVKCSSPQESIMSVVANTYATNFLDTSMRTTELQELAHLINSVPVRKLHPHRDISNLDKLCKLILEDFNSDEPKAPVA